MHLITLKEVTKKYSGKKVLNKISIDLDIGEFVVVLGKSGVGKSTLLNLLDFTIEQDSGTILFQNKKLNPKQRRFVKQNYIKKIYQNHNLIPYYTVYENLLLAKILTNKDKEEIDNFLLYLGIEDIKDKYIDEISGGERQRVSIIRALLDNPLIILADEPTGSLDEENRKKVLDLLKKNKEGKLIVLVTHNKKIAEKYADRVIEIKDDGSVEDDKKKEKSTDFELPIEKCEEVKFKNIFKLNMKSFVKRKSKIISLCLLIFLITICLSVFVGVKDGVNNYIYSLSNERIDKDVYHIYYESNEGIIEKEDVLVNASFEYHRSISYYYLLNNLFFNDFYIRDKSVEFYYEISLIYDETLNNKFYINSLMKEEKDFSSIKFQNNFINEEFELKEILIENSIYNSPRIYLSYQYIRNLFNEEIINMCIEVYPQIEHMYDYYILNQKDIYDFLKERKDCISIYKSVLSETKNFYVYNNSRVMTKETFQELFDNVVLIIELLGSIIFIFLSILMYLLLKYIYTSRRLEMGYILDQGGGSNDIAKLLISDLILVSVGAFLSSFLLSYIVSKLIEEITKIKFMINSITSTMVVYGIVFMIELIVVIFFLLSTQKEDLSLVLKEEN